MKLFIISTQVFPVTPDNKYAGIERLVLLLSRGLKDRGHKVTVAAPIGSRLPDGVEHFITGGTGDFVGAELSALNAYEFGLKNYDAIVDMSHSHWAMMKHDLPAIAFIWHDPMIMKCQEPDYNVCALSNWQKERFDKVYGYKAIVLDPHCSEVPVVETPGPSGRFLFVGKMGPDKGALEAIGLAKKADAGLDIVGVPGPGDPPAYLEEVKKQCDGKQVVYLGGVDDAERWRLTVKAKALIYPVHYGPGLGEAHSHKSIDAMMAGCPVITYNQGAMSEVIENGVTGYVCNNDSEFLTAMECAGELSKSKVHLRAAHRWALDVTASRVERALEYVRKNGKWGKDEFVSTVTRTNKISHAAPSQTAVQVALPPFPRQVRIDTMNSCNAKCLPCHLHHQSGGFGVMPKKIFDQVVDDIAGWPQPPAEIVPVNFGEFFLNKNWLELLQHIERKLPASGIVIPTNGELLYESRAYLLATIKNLKWVNFSVNAFFRETYEAFMRLPADNIDHIVKIADLLRRNRPDVITCASMVFDTCFQTEIERDRFIEFWTPKVNIVSINPAHYCNNPMRKPEIPLKTPCRSIIDGLTVLKDGRVVTNCCFDASGDLVVGDIQNSSLLEIWNGDALRHIIEIHNSGNREELSSCSHCTFA